MDAPVLDGLTSTTLTVDSGSMSEQEVRKASWFPAGIATEVNPIDSAPQGFSAWRISTAWMTFDALHLEDLDAALGGSTWGEVPVKERLRFVHLPVDSPIEGVEHLPVEMPCGGLKHEGRDLLLFYPRQSEGKSFVEALADEPVSACWALGCKLGELATAGMAKVSTSNEEQVWNERLKKMEDRLKTNTLWRAPHCSDTRGTITLRHLRIEHIRISKKHGVSIEYTGGGPESVLLEMSLRRPAISDLGAAFVLLHEHCPEQYREQCFAALGQGWSSCAPSSLSSAAALDAHRGGLHIWIYEAMLNRLALSRLRGEDDPPFISRLMADVSTIQAKMFHARSWSALALLCFLTGASLPIAFLWGYISTIELVLTPVFLFAGYLLKRLYRSKAPVPW